MKSITLSREDRWKTNGNKWILRCQTMACTETKRCVKTDSYTYCILNQKCVEHNVLHYYIRKFVFLQNQHPIHRPIKHHQCPSVQKQVQLQHHVLHDSRPTGAWCWLPRSSDVCGILWKLWARWQGGKGNAIFQSFQFNLFYLLANHSWLVTPKKSLW